MYTLMKLHANVLILNEVVILYYEECNNIITFLQQIPAPATAPRTMQHKAHHTTSYYVTKLKAVTSLHKA